jgi:hypothetical protein
VIRILNKINTHRVLILMEQSFTEMHHGRLIWGSGYLDAMILQHPFTSMRLSVARIARMAAVVMEFVTLNLESADVFMAMQEKGAQKS